jgi:hypothetical protein
MEAIEQAQLGLNMITFPLHTSHALKPLRCDLHRSLSKHHFRKERDSAMVKNNWTKPNKITLAPSE